MLTRERKAGSIVEKRLVGKKIMPRKYSSSRRKTGYVRLWRKWRTGKILETSLVTGDVSRIALSHEDIVSKFLESSDDAYHLEKSQHSI
jgi:hypothetical protein